MISPSPARLALLAACLLASPSLLACGTSVVDDPGAGGAGAGGAGAGGQGGGGGAVDCSLAPPGAAFQFQIHNAGTRELSLTYGCGETLPIVIDTADGPRGIGAGSGDFCEVSCDAVYQGAGNWGCSDCGPGSGEPLLPGASVVIDWDRRVYIPHEAPAACSGHEDGNSCALGLPVGNATSGTLTYCLGADSQGGCSDGSEAISFTMDLALSTVSIEIP